MALLFLLCTVSILLIELFLLVWLLWLTCLSLWFFYCLNRSLLALNKQQHHSKVLLNSFLMNGHTLGFCA